MSRILVVDDAQDIQMIVQKVLGDSQAVHSAYSLTQATDMLRKEKFDLILLDVELSDGDGFKYCAQLQEQESTKDIPVIFLTGKSDISDKIIGFSLGAEDYISKPFNPVELRLRCETRLKKAKKNAETENFWKIGDLRFEISQQKVFARIDHKESALDLTPTGFKLLHFLAKNESKVLSRDQLIAAIWGAGTHIVDRTVDTHVGALRKQLTGSVIQIESVHGVGYRLTDSSKAV